MPRKRRSPRGSGGTESGPKPHGLSLLMTHHRLHREPAAGARRQCRHATLPMVLHGTPGPGAEGTTRSLSERPGTLQLKFEALGGAAAKTAAGLELQRSCVLNSY